MSVCDWDLPTINFLTVLLTAVRTHQFALTAALGGCNLFPPQSSHQCSDPVIRAFTYAQNLFTNNIVLAVVDRKYNTFRSVSIIVVQVQPDIRLFSARVHRIERNL